MHSLRLEEVPVGNDHPSPCEQCHQVRRHEIPCAVQARLPSRRIELAQAITDGHIRTHDENDVRETRVAAAIDFVENAPPSEHAHDGGLARPRRHLGRVTEETGVAGCFPFVARLVSRNLYALAEIGTRFREEDDGLRRLELSKEKAFLAAVATPPLQELQRGSRHAWISIAAPRLHALANLVDQSHLNGGSTDACRGGLQRLFWIAVVVDGRPSSVAQFGRLSLGDVPVTCRRIERGIDDRFGDLVHRCHAA